MGNDHQQYMNPDTRAIDQAANEEAESKTVANFGAGEELVKKSKPGYHDYKQAEGVFGMLPTIPLPIDHAIERKDTFSKAALAHRESGWGGKPSGKSLDQMMKNYTDDAGKLSSVEREYNLLLPLANMAARAYAKADAVGAISDAEWSLDSSMTDLDDKEEKAVKGAIKAQTMNQNSMSTASIKLRAAREKLDEASHKFSINTNKRAMAALDEAMKKHSDRKAEIEASKSKVMKWVGYIETGGSLIAGGGAFLNKHSPGQPGAPEPSSPDLRPGEYETAEKVGGAAETGGGMLSKAVSFGIDLINYNELAKIEANIQHIKSELGAYGALNDWHEVEADKSSFASAISDYEGAVQAYNEVVANRRVEMASIGAAADKKVDKKGRDTDASQAVLWMESVMELQVHMQTAIAAGVDAKKTVDDVQSSVSAHRGTKWGTAKEHWEGESKPYTEKGISPDHGGPDADALFGMRRLLGNWMQGAVRVQELVDQDVSGNMKPFMAEGGYTGKF